MSGVNLNEIRAMHSNKRFDTLLRMAKAQDALSQLNAALLDHDSSRIQIYRNQLSSEGCNIRLINTADSIINKSRLRIAYLLPFTGMTGGTKILIEQSNHLAARGHDVLIYSHSPRPEWLECKAQYFFVHPDSKLYEVIPRVDVVIAGYWEFVVDALRVDAPIKIHFAQGDFDIFEFSRQEPDMQKRISTAYQLPLRIMTVSTVMKEHIKTLFGRHSFIIPNAVDKGVFFPKKKPASFSCLRILLVGSDTIKFKGHDTILGALYCLKNMGYEFDIHWLTQLPLTGNYKKLGFQIHQRIAPSQQEIGSIYRESDIYVCGSMYESFGLPVLEAMTCGTAVVTSDNGGIRDYAVDGINSLLYEPGNVRMLVDKLQMLFEDTNLRQSLIMEGIKTSRSFSWNKSITQLEKELHKASITTMQAIKA